jgi:hypothetical protein
MADACCAPDEHGHGSSERDDGVESEPKVWQIREFQLAGAAGALVLAGFLTGWWWSDTAATALFLLAAALGGWTFVPKALRSMLRLRIGVGTLMTIALVGALILGEFAEAAMLAFLFSISEALEDYSLSKTRRSLRALLALVPDKSRSCGPADPPPSNPPTWSSARRCSSAPENGSAATGWSSRAGPPSTPRQSPANRCRSRSAPATRSTRARSTAPCR